MSDTLNLVERADGTIVNETNGDPSVKRVLGHRRYWVAADLGQANDFTASIVIEDEQLPVLNDGRCELGPRTLTVVHADRFRGVSYVAVCDYLVRLKNARQWAGKSQLIIDGTSIGREMSDMLTEANVPHTAVQMTGGQEWRRSGKFVNAAKTLIIESTAVAFAAGELRFAHDLPLREDIEADLGTFTIVTTAAGNSIIAQKRSSGGHGDLGIALVIGCFAAQYLKPQSIGQAKLQGWY